MLTLGAGTVTQLGPRGAGAARRAVGRRRCLAPGPARAHAPGAGASLRTRRRFARRQWARRWLALRYVRGRAACSWRLVVGGSGRSTSPRSLAVQGVEVDGAAQLERRRGPRRGRRAATASRWPGSTSTRSAPGSRRWPRCASADVTRAVARPRAGPVRERVAVAVVEIGGQARGMDADGVVFRDYAKPPAGLPQVRTTTVDPQRRPAEAAEVVSALPADLARRVDHVEVETVDQISLVLRDGRTVAWGSAEDSDTKAEVLAVLLSQPAETYDVSVPGQPTTSG